MSVHVMRERRRTKGDVAPVAQAGHHTSRTAYQSYPYEERVACDNEERRAKINAK